MKNYNKNNKCINCGKLIHNISKRCGSCAKKYYWKTHPSTPKKYYCIDCEKKVSDYRVKRCPSCSAKKNLNRYIDGRTFKKYHCIDCNKEIGVKSGFWGQGRCKSCAQRERWQDLEYKSKVSKKISISVSGINSPFYIHGKGYEPYTKEFNNQLKEQIRKRDNYQCQKCGKKQEELEGRFKKLDVHHIDYNKENLNIDNLISLCHDCNLRANSNRDYWFVYFSYVMENKK